MCEPGPGLLVCLCASGRQVGPVVLAAAAGAQRAAARPANRFRRAQGFSGTRRHMNAVGPAGGWAGTLRQPAFVQAQCPISCGLLGLREGERLGPSVHFQSKKAKSLRVAQLTFQRPPSMRRPSSFSQARSASRDHGLRRVWGSSAASGGTVARLVRVGELAQLSNSISAQRARASRSTHRTLPKRSHSYLMSRLRVTELTPSTTSV